MSATPSLEASPAADNPLLGASTPLGIDSLPRPHRNVLKLAADYWTAPDEMFRHLEGLGDRFVIDLPGLPTWVCTTNPDDVKTIFTAQQGSLGVYLDAIGTVTPVYTSSITAQVTGVIVGVHYKEGQLVHKGDPLIDIDPRLYQASLAQAQGALERDQNLLAQAQMDLERYQVAWSHNAIPRQTLDSKIIALQISKDKFKVRSAN